MNHSGHTTNGVLDHPSPATDSPATPADSHAPPDVTIDMHYDQEQESDVRHEPLPVKINGHNDALNDVPMDTQTPADSSFASIDPSPATRSLPDDSDDTNEPPAKRARINSDADMASLTHSATPPPASTAVSPAPQPISNGLQESSITLNQFRFLLSTLRSLKKMKDAVPFLRPVDPVALNIPHYTSIIKQPMDLSTVERKLNSSNPQKPDSNPHNPRYIHAEEFIADVRLMVTNAVTFNGPEHVVAAMGKRMEDVFDKSIKHLPPRAEKPKPPVPKKVATPPPPPPPVVPPPKKAQPTRRASTSVPVIRRSEAEAVGRPKREIHPPPPKDLPYADVPKKNRKPKRAKADGNSEQLKFCVKLLADMHRKQYYNIAYPFYEPVDWQKLDIPSYPKVIKKPMDLSSIRKKLEGGDYHTAHGFYDDFKLMIRNCFTFNPSGTPVSLAGQELQKLFDEKWKSLPTAPIQDATDDDEEEDEYEDKEEERLRAIAMMESQIETMKSNIESLRSTKPPKEKKKKEKKEKVPVASTSKPSTKQPKTSGSKKKPPKKNITDEDVLSFEQKKDLSESISKLDGARLERVIGIIHEGVPEIRDSTEEIELEIDQLPAAVLTKLYNYVLRPIRQPAQPKRNRTGKGTGTGGLKRKSMDEEKEAEKIRQLEERMALFEPRGAGAGAAGAGGAAGTTKREDDSEHSSDSSSGSDSSGSDSE